MISAIVTCFGFEDGPPCSWGSLLGDGSTMFKDCDSSPELVELSSEL